MRIQIIVPTELLFDEEVTKIIAEAENGSFCLLPRHVDFVAALVPGLLLLENEAGQETFFAIDEGVLVKCGDEVRVVTREAMRGVALEELQHIIETKFRMRDEHEKIARVALAGLEASLVRGVLGERSAQ